MSTPLDQLVKVLSSDAGPTPVQSTPTPAFALATIQQINGNVINTDGTLNVTFDAQNIVAINLLDLFDPVFGMNVLCLVYGTQAFAVGPYSPGVRPDGGSVPIGTICLWGAPLLTSDGLWMECDGSAVSRIAYSTLFTRYASTWGPGDGSTTFNLPDLRDKVPIGANTVLTLGQSGGSRTISGANLPSHQHTGHTGGEDGSHIHGFPVSSIINGGGGPFSLNGPGIIGVSAIVGMLTSTENAPHGHAFTTDATGSGAPYLPPAAGLIFMIRVL